MVAEMGLVRREFDALVVEWGQRTAFSEGSLQLSQDDILSHLPREVAGCHLHLVPPDASVRITHVLDAVPLMTKRTGPGTVFPGWRPGPIDGGRGATDVLTGVHLLTVSQFPLQESGLRASSDGLLDKRGLLAPCCYGSDAWSIVLETEPAAGLSNAAYDDALRRFALNAAESLARSALSDRGAPTRELEWGERVRADGDAPAVVLVLQLRDQGPLVRCYLYGEPLGIDLFPTALSASELADGALVSGNYRPCMKIPTAVFTDHPLLRSLRAAQDRGAVTFAGVVISRGHHDDPRSKERSAEAVARLAARLGADGAILDMEGTGNATIDFMLTIRALEAHGVRAVAVAHEFSGTEGRGDPLVFTVPEADALVSGGAMECPLEVDPLDEIIGGPYLHASGGVTYDLCQPQRIRPYECFGAYCKMVAAGVAAVDF